MGLVVSTTEMEEAQVAVFPLLSVTVRVTEFVPTFRQVKLELDNTSVAMPQLSVELLFTCALVIEPVPDPFRMTVKLLHKGTGGRTSLTVTIELHEFEFPVLSVTVKVTGLGPTFAQEKEFGESEIDVIVQLSVEPLLT